MNSINGHLLNTSAGSHNSLQLIRFFTSVIATPDIQMVSYSSTIVDIAILRKKNNTLLKFWEFPQS